MRRRGGRSGAERMRRDGQRGWRGGERKARCAQRRRAAQGAGGRRMTSGKRIFIWDGTLLQIFHIRGLWRAQAGLDAKAPRRRSAHRSKKTPGCGQKRAGEGRRWRDAHPAQPAGTAGGGAGGDDPAAGARAFGPVPPLTWLRPFPRSDIIAPKQEGKACRKQPSIPPKRPCW